MRTTYDVITLALGDLGLAFRGLKELDRDYELRAWLKETSQDATQGAAKLDRVMARLEGAMRRLAGVGIESERSDLPEVSSATVLDDFGERLLLLEKDQLALTQALASSSATLGMRLLVIEGDLAKLIRASWKAIDEGLDDPERDLDSSCGP